MHPAVSRRTLATVCVAVLGFVVSSPRAASAADPATVFAESCGGCHGTGGAGDGPVGVALQPPPADLTDPAFQDARSNDQLAAVIRDGGAVAGLSPLMPPFGATLDAEQITALVGWIRAQRTEAAPAEGAEAAPGDAPAGAPAAAPAPTGRAPKRAALPANSPFSRTRFHLAGFATVHFEYTEETGPSFSSVQLAPVFLWRLHDRFLFEAEMEMGYAAGSFEIGLEYSQLDIVLWDYTTLVVGLSLNPLGIFGERLHPGWINRMMDNPYPYQGGHGAGPLPMAGLGIQARGAIPLGQASSVNYAFFFSNGPAETDGTISLGGSVPDNNWDKNFGGRIGVLPIRELEIGVSGTTGLWNDTFDQRYSAIIGDLMFARSGLNFQGEYFATFTEMGEGETLTRQYWWAQLAYRLEPAPGILNKFEVVFRYGGADLPKMDAEGMSSAAVLAAAEEAGALQGIAFSAGHAAEPADDHGAMSNAALPEGTSHQVGGGVNFYPIPAIAVRLGAHYTIETQHFHLGLSLAAGF